jgi:phospholipase/carboxylesterase
VSELVYHERASAGEPEGLLILQHGRGTDEQDLLTLGEVLDPDRRLLIVTPRAPLELPGSPGYHWYLVSKVGYPDPDSFHAAYSQLAALHEELWERTGIAPARTIIGGFSMGAAMSYALGLGAGRPAPAGILAFSGFIPTVEGWSADLAAHKSVRVFMAHGRLDPIIEVDFARDAASRLREAGLQVDYHESESTHHIDPRQIPLAGTWLASTLRAREADESASSQAPAAGNAAPSEGSA